MAEQAYRLVHEPVDRQVTFLGRCHQPLVQVGSEPDAGGRASVVPLRPTHRSHPGCGSALGPRPPQPQPLANR